MTSGATVSTMPAITEDMHQIRSTSPSAALAGARDRASPGTG
jgi:hypothetical protein